MSECAVEFSSVSFGYGDAPVLIDVDFSIRHHDFVGIVGPNGGGKTTLLKLLLGLIEPQAGTVSVLGLPPSRARRRLGYVPQQFAYDVAFPISVLDVVLMGRLGVGNLVGPYRPADVEDARIHLEQVGLADLTHRDFSAMSGGQRQRALIARALVSHPEMLILDEPTASLDAQAEANVHELLDELHRTMTIIMVTHDFSFVSHSVETVLCVNRHVRRHPTTDLGEMSGEVLSGIYGTQLRAVRHDQSCGGEPDDN